MCNYLVFNNNKYNKLHGMNTIQILNCRHELKNGWVCIIIHEDLEFFSISLDKYCKEKILRSVP